MSASQVNDINNQNKNNENKVAFVSLLQMIIQTVTIIIIITMDSIILVIILILIFGNQIHQPSIQDQGSNMDSINHDHNNECSPSSSQLQTDHQIKILHAMDIDPADNLQTKTHLNCYNCKRNCDMDEFQESLIVDNLISAFIDKWFCNDYKNGCKKWMSIKWFYLHLKRFHFDNGKVLDMIGMKLCIDPDCTEVIDKDSMFCQSHYQLNNISQDYQQSIFGKCKIDNDKNDFICHNGQILDLIKLIQVFDYSDRISENDN